MPNKIGFSIRTHDGRVALVVARMVALLILVAFWALATPSVLIAERSKVDLPYFQSSTDKEALSAWQSLYTNSQEAGMNNTPNFNETDEVKYDNHANRCERVQLFCR